MWNLTKTELSLVYQVLKISTSNCGSQLSDFFNYNSRTNEFLRTCHPKSARRGAGPGRGIFNFVFLLHSHWYVFPGLGASWPCSQVCSILSCVLTCVIVWSKHHTCRSTTKNPCCMNCINTFYLHLSYVTWKDNLSNLVECVMSNFPTRTMLILLRSRYVIPHTTECEVWIIS